MNMRICIPLAVVVVMIPCKEQRASTDWSSTGDLQIIVVVVEELVSSMESGSSSKLHANPPENRLTFGTLDPDK